MVIITGRRTNKDNNTTVVLLLSREWWDGLRELALGPNPQTTPLIVQGVYEDCADYYKGSIPCLRTKHQGVAAEPWLRKGVDCTPKA